MSGENSPSTPGGGKPTSAPASPPKKKNEPLSALKLNLSGSFDEYNRDERKAGELIMNPMVRNTSGGASLDSLDSDDGLSPAPKRSGSSEARKARTGSFFSSKDHKPAAGSNLFVITSQDRGGGSFDGSMSLRSNSRENSVDAFSMSFDSDNMIPESFLLDQAAYESWRATQRAAEAEATQKETQRQKQLRVAVIWMRKHRIVSPESTFRRNWDVAQIFALFYVSLVVPYRIGFDHDTGPWEFWFVIDILLDIYFFIDIGANFRTAFYDEHGELIYEPVQIAKRYLRTWFAIDALSCLPVNYILPLMKDQYTTDASGLRLLRLVRLLKLLRLARLSRLIVRYQEEFYALMTSFNIIKLIVLMMIIGHWLCCLWFYFGNADNYVCPDAGQAEDATGSCPALNEMAELAPDGRILRGWVHQHFSGGAKTRTTFAWKYLMALYWSMMTMTTVGYGDIAATTSAEHVVSIIGMLIGGFVFGLIVGNLSEISRRANPAGKIMQKELSKISSFVHSRGVDSDVCRQVRTYYSTYFNNFTAIEKIEMYQRLPIPLRNELMVQLGYLTGNRKGRAAVSYGLLHKVPFLTNLDNNSVIQICMRLKLLEFEPAIQHRVTGLYNHYIMREGEQASEMFVIMSGKARVESNEELLGVAKKGDFFGELSVLVDRTSMRTARSYTRSAAAISLCEVAVLSAEDTLELSEKHPFIKEALHPYIIAAKATESEYKERMLNTEPRCSGMVRMDLADTGRVKIEEDSFLSVLGDYSPKILDGGNTNKSNWTPVYMTVEHGLLTIKDAEDSVAVREQRSLVGCEYIATDDGHNGETMVFQLEIPSEDPATSEEDAATIMTFGVDDADSLKRWLRAVHAACKPRLLYDSESPMCVTPRFALSAGEETMGGGGGGGPEQQSLSNRMDNFQVQLNSVERKMDAKMEAIQSQLGNLLRALQTKTPNG